MTRHFDCTTSNIIYYITCTLCSKLYKGESGRKFGDRFREHLLDVKNKGSDLSKPVARHFNLPGHSHEHMEIRGINLHLGNNETRKRKEQRLIFKLGTKVSPTESMNGFHSHSFKHIFDQLDATNFSQWQNLNFRSVKIVKIISVTGLTLKVQSSKMLCSTSCSKEGANKYFCCQLWPWQCNTDSR